MYSDTNVYIVQLFYFSYIFSLVLGVLNLTECSI